MAFSSIQVWFVYLGNYLFVSDEGDEYENARKNESISKSYNYSNDLRCLFKT